MEKKGRNKNHDHSDESNRPKYFLDVVVDPEKPSPPFMILLGFLSFVFCIFLIGWVIPTGNIACLFDTDWCYTEYAAVTTVTPTTVILVEATPPSTNALAVENTQNSNVMIVGEKTYEYRNQPTTSINTPVIVATPPSSASELVVWTGNANRGYAGTIHSQNHLRTGTIISAGTYLVNIY